MVGLRRNAGSLLSLLSVISLLGATSAPSVGQGILTFAPTSIVFDSVAVGGMATESILLKNKGSSQATISDVFALSGDAQLAASPTSFVLAPDQSQVVTFTFTPMHAGNVVDAFKLVSDATVFGSTAPVINVPVSAVATGARLTLSEPRLSFQSLSVGSPVRDTVVVGNAGNEPLNVLSFVVTSQEFSVPSTPFELAPGDTQPVVVTYTPSTTQALSDTLTILSDSPDASLSFLGLDGLETPTQPRSARINLLRTDGSGTPAVGDSIRVAVFLVPNADTLRGVEVFLGFDNTLLAPVPDMGSGDEGPVRRSGLTTGLDFQLNTTEGPGTKNAAVHFSSFFGQDTRGADTLAVVVFEVLADIREATTIRILTENPLRNSNFLSPENFSFAIPGSLGVSFGNQAPVITSFGIVTFDEDSVFAIGLNERAADQETATQDLAWLFEDGSNLFTFSIEADSVRITPPLDGFGVFDVTVIVTDTGGTSDTVSVILNVQPTNDPPDVPVYSSPADNAEGLTTPVTLRWAGGDPEGDTVTYEVRLGTTAEGLQPIASNVAVPEHETQGLGASTTYFWQIVTVDEANARREGEIRQFTTAPDETAPQITLGAVTVSSTAATIVWDTDETSTSTIRYGLSPTLADSADFGVVGDDVFLVLRHEVELAGLAPSTTYFYRSSSRDLFGNVGASSISSFTTDEPQFVLGDFDANLTIDFNDFLMFAETFNLSLGDPGYNLRGDFDGNNTVDFSDFLEFAGVFGTTVTKP